MEPNQLARALRIVRTIAGFSMLAVVAATLFVPPRLLLAAAPVCAVRAAGNGECPLCGMTGAFLAVARGDLREAAARNAAAVPLYALFTLCGAAAAADLVSRRARGRRSPFPSPHPQEQPCK